MQSNCVISDGLKGVHTRQNTLMTFNADCSTFFELWICNQLFFFDRGENSLYLTPRAHILAHIHLQALKEWEFHKNMF